MFRRTFMFAGVVTVASTVFGCKTSTEFNPAKLGRDNDPTMQTQLTAFAAKTENRYPEGVRASDDLKVASIVTREDGSLRLYNFTGETLSDMKVWINGEYVTPLRAIAPNGKEVIPRKMFYNSVGTALSTTAAGISRVQLEREGKLYNVMGPAFE